MCRCRSVIYKTLPKVCLLSTSCPDDWLIDHRELSHIRSKALTEQGLAELGYDDFIVFRPAWFTGALREHGRFGELMLRWVYLRTARYPYTSAGRLGKHRHSTLILLIASCRPFIGFASLFSASVSIPVRLTYCSPLKSRGADNASLSIFSFRVSRIRM